MAKIYTQAKFDENRFTRLCCKPVIIPKTTFELKEQIFPRKTRHRF